MGLILTFAGRPQEGLGLVKKAMRLDPHYSFIYLYYLGNAYYAMEKYEEAIAALKKGFTRNPDLMVSHLVLAVIYSELGRKEEAQAEVAETLRISPRASMEGQRERMPFKDQAVLERYLNALRKTGLPEKSRSTAPDGDIDPKVRNCLACRRPFESAWAGERICPKCKSSSSWRSGSAFQYPAAKRS